jgi:hypothetical protein
MGHTSTMFELLYTHDGPPDAAQAIRADAQWGPYVRRGVLCARCGAQLTDASQRTAVSGQHEHTFFNPAGIVYHVACFASVPGCRGVGPYCGDFSWFPGQRWQIACCASCGEHVGWHFTGDSIFTCLITTRIREQSA